jgi:signal transduction histidine kinase
MESELRAAEEHIALSALDALTTHIAILDGEGQILAINKAWREFGVTQQPACNRGGVGSNYLLGCDQSGGGASNLRKFADGIHSVLRGRRSEFSMEYPCRIGTEERWFHGKVTRFPGRTPVRLLIAHEDISERVRLEREILAVSSREQERFGQELHDGLSQHLTGLKFKTSLLEYQLSSKQLPEASDAKALSELLNEATEQASRLARRVQPVEAEARGLMMALRELAATTEHNHHVSCRCQIRRPVFIYDNTLATHVYRIVEEAITNAITHGDAETMSVNLAESRNLVTVTVRDNGRGMANESLERRDRLGLHIMHYRARLIGASLELRNNVDGGVTLMCSFHKMRAAAPREG